MLRLDTPVSKLPQVSDARSEALAQLGVKTIRDLIYLFPQRYIDMSEVSTILDAKIGYNYTISAKVHSVEEKEPKPGLKLIEITLTDETGTLIATAFNQKWLLDTLKVNDMVAVGGKVEFNYGFKRITNPFIHVLDDKDSSQNIAKVVPVHPSNEKISSSWVRNIISNAFEFLGSLDNIIPQSYVDRYKLMDYFKALYDVHFPNSMKELELAKRTIKYCEALLQQLYVLKGAAGNSQLFVCEFVSDKIKKAVESISLFKDSGSQTLMLTPSSIMLAQYKQKFIEKFKDLHVAFQIIDEDTSKENRWKAIYDFKNGDLDLIVGTKDLLNEDIESKNLSLLVIDEKDQFSLDEISKAKSFLNSDADEICLTTRPLTKSFATLLYPNSTHTRVAYKETHKCETFVHENDLRMNAYEAAVNAVKGGMQCLVVTPELDFLIDEISTKIFNGWNIGIIKSDTPTKEALSLLNDFNAGKIEILICSRDIDFVIEPNSDLVAIVENADRLGSSKLHQIRNFILKTFDNSQLHLICFTKSKLAIQRLKSFSQIMDGASVVAKDLESRNDASKLGFNSWGFSVLKLINIEVDLAIIETANKDAHKILSTDPELKEAENKLLSFEISRVFEN